MIYQIECGHCRTVIELDDEAIGCSVPCPVCGGMHAVVSPIPTIPIATEAFDFPALKHDQQVLAHTKTETRARFLQPPWPTVRRGLFVTLLAIHVAMVIYILFLFTELVIAPIAPRKFAPLMSRVLVFLVIAQLVPILFHTVGQLFCVLVPKASGSPLVRISVILQLCSALALIGFPLIGIYAVMGSVALMLSSYGTWLTFLARMGRTFCDPALVRQAWSFASWFWSCLATVVALFVGAFLAKQAGDGLIVWVCHTTAGVIGLLLLVAYYGLLTTALRGIARYAPV